MPNRKIYTAFISSEFESLQDERNIVINKLLDNRIMPICMEHFTATSSGQFEDLKELIDDSDLFILLLGKNYGSCDAEGISWTQREYEYAVSKKKQIIAVICDELAEAKKKEFCTLSPSEQKQIEFSNKIPFARTVSEGLNLTTIIEQALVSSLPRCDGWLRDVGSVMTDEDLEKWREENKAFNLAGTWYHMHLSEFDEQYIRLGTITISQTFTPDKYKELKFSGTNYDILRYDKNTNTIKCNLMKKSRFNGDYKLEDDGKIYGMFISKREFSSKFKEQEIGHGERRGIHDFFIETSGNNITEEFTGEFHDEAPSPKMGRIFVYRSEDRRNEELMEYRGHIIKSE